MTASSRRHTRAGRLAMALLACAGAACDDFPRTNPYDAQAQVTFVVDGPDSVTAIGDTVTFEVHTAEGQRLNALVRWTVPSFLRQIDEGGRFIATGIDGGGVRGVGSVTATLNANTASKLFVFSQQSASLSATECFANRVMSFIALMRPLDQQLGSKFVCVELRDRRGARVSDQALVLATVRDSRVARFVDAQQRRVNALAAGSTYVVYTQSGLSDSIRVDVRQDPAMLTPDPAACDFNVGVKLTPGQTVQLKALPPLRDYHGVVIDDAVLTQRVLASLRWSIEGYLQVTVEQDGLVTAVAPGVGYVKSSYLDGATERVLSHCRIVVN